jgi:phosphomannomutase
MITASHNPPSDNAVKVYWSTGGQLLPPHDTDSIARMQSVTKIERIPFAEAMAAGKIVYCQEEVDKAFIAAVLKQSLPGPRDIKIIYSPLHGVGASAVMPALDAAGFKDVEPCHRSRLRPAGLRSAKNPLPSPFGRGAGGEGFVDHADRQSNRRTVGRFPA